MFDGGVVFDFYSYDCFLKNVALFNSRICVWELSGHVDVLIGRSEFSFLLIVSHFLFFFFFLPQCILYFCVSAWVIVSMYVYEYTFVFFFLIPFPLKNLW